MEINFTADHERNGATIPWLCRCLLFHKNFSAGIITFLLFATAACAGENGPILWGSDRLAAALPVDPALAPVRQSGRLKLTLPRATARPGERYLEAVLELAGPVPEEDMEWRAEIFSSAGSEPAASSDRAVTANKATFRFDARAVGSSGIVQVTLVQGGLELASAREVFSSEPELSFAGHGDCEVWLDDAFPGQRDGAPPSWVTFGLPVPAGALWDVTKLRLEDEEGNRVPAGFQSTALWGEGGSHKWLRVDALVGEGRKLRVREAASDAGETRPLVVERAGEGIRVDTGSARYLIEPRGALLTEIASGDQQISMQTAKGRGLYVIDQQDRTGVVSAPDTEVRVEFQNEFVVRVRVSGMHRAPGKKGAAGEELARFTAWFDFAAGRPECRITHHFILTRDSNEIWFHAIGWEFDLDGWKADRAQFSSNREDPEAMETLPLSKDPVVMAQLQHRRYRGGADEFALGKPGDRKAAREGEMGDWAAAISEGRGLLVGCHEAARQHPKAFVVSPTLLALDLFHPGAGEELDFRSPALVRRWNSGGMLSADLAASTAKLPTNAVGWSKTHVLHLSPAAGPDVADALARAGVAFAFPVQACTDPAWTHQSRVAGPLFPRDAERFPQVESFIDEAFDYWAGEQEHFGEYGFVDYFAGPHHTREFPQRQGRFRASYTLRNAFWLLYLRSGERKFREMASGSNRTYLDSYLSAWDGPSRLRGLYVHSVGEKDPYAGLPYYWEGFTRPSMGSHTNLDQFLLDYYLTGNPRAKDGVLSYAEGVGRWWKDNRSDWRILAVLRAVNRAYALTWDPGLRAMQEEILNAIYDPRSPVFLAFEGRPYTSSTYKTQEDLSAMIEGWELHGTRRYWNIADAVSRFWWQSLGAGGRFEAGRSGAFLWETDHDLSIAQRLWGLARHEVTLAPGSTSAAAEFRFQGMPYALSAIAESGADQAPVASWAGVEVLTGRAGLLLGKKDRTAPIRASLQFERPGLQNLPEIQALGTVSKIGQRLLTLRAGYDDGMTLLLPPETENADFFIPVPEHGIHEAYLDGLSPMVLYADGWWKPAPETLDPPAEIFFNLPPGAGEATIHFEQPARLTAPDGTPWPGEKPVRGKIALPEERPGVWRFAASGGGAVRLTGIPPLFAFESPQALGEIGDARPDLPPPFSYGAWQGTALERGATRVLESPKVPLPFREGTIEFFYKPAWDSFDLQSRTVKRLLRFPTEKGKPWSLIYVVDSGRLGWSGHPWSKSHVLEMEIESAGAARRPEAVCVRKTIFERDRWVHVAIVWGERMFGYTADRTQLAFDVKVFIDGVEGRYAAWPRQGNRAAAPPQALELGPDLDGEISHLRISGTRRYTGDFSPPDPAKIQRDRDTLYFDAFTPDGGMDAFDVP